MGFQGALTAGNYTSLRGAASTVPTYTSRQYVSLCPNTTIFAARVNQATFGTSFAEITYDTVTVGAFGDIDVGQTVYLSRTNSIREAYFTGRVRKAPTSTILYINETSVDVDDNDYIFVIDDFRIWDKLPRAVSKVQRKDYDITYRAIPPIVTGLQSAYAGVVSGSPAGLTIAFSVTGLATTSGATISTYAWTIETGMTVTAGSASTATVTIRFDAGFYWLKLVVTDSGGRTRTRWTPIWAVPTDFSSQVATGFTGASISADASGWSAQVQAFTGIDTIYDNTLVCVWEIERYNNTEGSIYTTVKYVGRLRTETDRGRSDETFSFVTETDFEVESTSAQLARLQLRSIAMRYKVTPTVWDQITNLTIWRAIVHVLSEHSTFLDLHDLAFDSTANTFLYKILNTQGANLLAVIEDLASAINAHFEFAPTGQSQVVRDGRYLTTAERSALTTVAAFTTADLIDLQLDIEHIDPIGRIEASGGTFNSTSLKVTPFLSIAPGAAQAYGEGQAQLAGQILQASVTKAVATSELNARTGHHLALNNGADVLTITHPDGYGILFPSVNQWVTWTLAASTNAYGRAYDTSDRWLVESVTYTSDNEAGTKQVEVKYVLETVGTPGQTVTYPKTGQITFKLSQIPNYPIYTNFPVSTTVYLPPNAGEDGTQPIEGNPDAVPGAAPRDGNTVAIWSISGSFDSGKLYITRSFLTSGTPAWTDITPTDLPTGWSIRNFEFSPFGRGGYLLAGHYYTTGNQAAVWYTADVFADTVVWTKGATQTESGTLVFDIMRLTSTAGEVYIRRWDSITGPNLRPVRYSSDNGLTFGANLSLGSFPGYFGFDTQRVGAVSLAAQHDGTNPRVYRATTAGGAYSTYGSSSVPGFVYLFIPRCVFGATTGNDGSNVEYLGSTDTPVVANNYLIKVTASGATLTDITPQFGADYGAANLADDPHKTLCMPWLSGSIIVAALDFNGTVKLAVSSNAGSSWTDRGALTAGNHVVMRKTDTTLNQIFIADGTAGPKYSHDRGATVVTKTSPTTDSIVGIEVYG